VAAVRELLVPYGEPNSPMPGLGLNSVRAMFANDCDDVSERQPVGEKWYAAQLEPLLVLSPRPHLLEVARHSIGCQIKPHDVVGPLARRRLVVSRHFGFIDHQ
jgi:hypothetical protein